MGRFGGIALEGTPAPASRFGGVAVDMPLTAQQEYDAALANWRKVQMPRVSDEQFAQVANEKKPYSSIDLLGAGLTMGLNDEVAGAATALANFTMGKDAGAGYAATERLERARQRLGAEQQGALGTVAEIGGTVLAGRPDMAATRVAGLVPTMIDGATGGAVGGGVYGFGSTDGDLGDRLVGAAKGAAAGAATGAAVPAVVAGAGRVISPIAPNAATRSAARALEREGVELTAGQTMGNRNLMFREAELGGQAGRDFVDRQADQFTGAVLQRVGVNAPRATHEVLDNAYTAIGDQFDTLGRNNTLVPDQQLAQDLQGVWREYHGNTNASSRLPRIENTIRDIYGRGSAGPMAGTWYTATRSALGRLTKASDPEVVQAARGLIEALDDAMERSVTAAGRPEQAAAFQEARRLYRNYLVVEDAATRAGADSAEGIISPQALRSAAIRQGRRAYARGQNEFTELADAGVTAMSPLPDSGTAGRLNAKTILPLGAGSGATVGGIVGGIPGAAVGLGVGAAIPWAIGRAMLSRAGRRYLTNQAAGPVGRNSAVIGALMGRGEQPLLPWYK